MSHFSAYGTNYFVTNAVKVHHTTE